MPGWRVALNRIRGLFTKRSHEKELDAELRAHLELLTEENIRRGMNPAEARYAARREFGGFEQTKELYRDFHGFPFLENLARDLRFAFRSLMRNHGLSFIAIFALTLGIGATTVMFSVVHSVFVDALPYKDFDRSVVFKIQNLANVGGWKGRDFFLRSVSNMTTADPFATGREVRLSRPTLSTSWAFRRSSVAPSLRKMAVRMLRQCS